MNSVLSFFKSWISSNRQSAKITGDHNTVTQTNNIYVSDIGELQEILKGSPSAPKSIVSEQVPPSKISIDAADDDGTEEFQLISKYREIANDGEAGTSLRLLRGLKDDERFSGGVSAFRLRFNIGIVLQNIGQYEEAIAELKQAFDFCPEHPKAKAGIALADLLQGNDEDALRQAEILLSVEGDHVNFCASVAFSAAKRLKRNFDVERYELVDRSNADLMLARLDYLEAVQADLFEKELQEALSKDPDNHSLLLLWAHHFLKNANENRAFLLGGRTSEAFETNISKSASILVAELEKSLKHNPPNRHALPFDANNAAVALRLDGREVEAAHLLDRVTSSYPEIKPDLAQLRAALYLHQDQDAEALDLIKPMMDHPDLQIMAAEIEAQTGAADQALERINRALAATLPQELRLAALFVKARIGLVTSDRNAADEAIDELQSDFKKSSELALIKSIYARIFEVQPLEQVGRENESQERAEAQSDREIITELLNVEGKEFFELFQAANELANRGHFRESCDLLRDRVSWSRESPALQLLCDSCVRGGLATLASEINENLSQAVRNSPFGWKFGANTAFLSGEIVKAVPLTRKLFTENPKSLSALQWYIQSLARMNDESRIRRVVKGLVDFEMTGTVAEKQDYVNLLVFSRQINRSRSFAYRLFCEHQHDHRAWMALSASVLALGYRSSSEADLWSKSVEEHTAVEVLLPSGEKRKYIIEPDQHLAPLRSENISENHPIARAMLGLSENAEFEWPVKGQSGIAKIIQIKHKVLDAFHFVMHRFEERFPDANGFASVICDPTKSDGLDEILELLRQRALYGRQKVSEYQNGLQPLAVLGVALGLDTIDTFIGIHREAGGFVKVSTCRVEDQERASVLLKKARKTGIILDALSIYLLRRLDLADVVASEFGKIGITQHTHDVYANRLREVKTMGGYDENGKRVAGSMAFRDGKFVLAEMSEEEIQHKVDLHQNDFDWILEACEIIPSIAREDPPDEIIRLRNSPGGNFLDDLFACDGSGRILMSEDLSVRQIGEAFFGTEGFWIQALLFDLEKAKLVSAQKVVSASIHLLEAGEHALSLNSFRIRTAAEMLASAEITEQEFQTFCSVVGQVGANLESHIRVALEAIEGLWRDRAVASVKHRAISVILRNIIRHQGEYSATVIDAIEARIDHSDIREYIKNWKIGHFILHPSPDAKQN